MDTDISEDIRSLIFAPGKSRLSFIFKRVAVTWTVVQKQLDRSDYKNLLVKQCNSCLTYLFMLSYLLFQDFVVTIARKTSTTVQAISVRMALRAWIESTSTRVFAHRHSRVPSASLTLTSVRSDPRCVTTARHVRIHLEVIPVYALTAGRDLIAA